MVTSLVLVIMGIIGSYNSLGRWPALRRRFIWISIFLPNAFSSIVMAPGAAVAYAISHRAKQ